VGPNSFFSSHYTRASCENQIVLVPQQELQIYHTTPRVWVVRDVGIKVDPWTAHSGHERAIGDAVVHRLDLPVVPFGSQPTPMAIVLATLLQFSLPAARLRRAQRQLQQT
jgi:hypothetical protein